MSRTFVVELNGHSPARGRVNSYYDNTRGHGDSTRAVWTTLSCEINEQDD